MSHRAVGIAGTVREELGVWNPGGGMLNLRVVFVGGISLRSIYFRI